MEREGLGFVITAYAATWVAMLGYLVWLRGALRRARRLPRLCGRREREQEQDCCVQMPHQNLS